MRFARFTAALLIGGSALAYAGSAALAAEMEVTPSNIGQSFTDYSKMKGQPGDEPLAGARLPGGESEGAPSTFNSDLLDEQDAEWVPLDIDGDGTVDAVGLDSNGDGYYDAVLVDEDQDGEIDYGLYDLNYDGTIDMEMVVVTDDEGNQADVYILDEDQDGNPELIGYDLDQDGEIDEWEEV